MGKTMCKIAKELPESKKIILLNIQNHKYVCNKCGRVANKEKLLCKPDIID